MYIVMAGTAILAVVAAIYTPTLMNWGDYGDVSVEEASNLISDKPDLVILDVRTQTEYDDGHIEGAILFPHTELADRLDELDKNDEILVYCRTGNRSSTAIEILGEAGFSKVYHMNDGITEWISEGYPVVQ
jgi:rhodanese-related sulfurtransferase